MTQAVEIGAKIAQARIKPLADENGGRPKNDRNLDIIKVSHAGGTGTDYTLRRLARDCPEMLVVGAHFEPQPKTADQLAIKGIKMSPLKRN